MHADRASVVIYLNFDFGEHVLTIMQLRDPTYTDKTVMRNFVCQAFVLQYALIIEEVDDIAHYLERVASLRTVKDPTEFLTLYDSLFHVRLSRAPRKDEWHQGPLAYIVVGSYQ